MAERGSGCTVLHVLSWADNTALSRDFAADFVGGAPRAVKCAGTWTDGPRSGPAGPAEVYARGRGRLLPSSCAGCRCCRRQHMLGVVRALQLRRCPVQHVRVRYPRLSLGLRRQALHERREHVHTVRVERWAAADGADGRVERMRLRANADG